MMVYNIVKIICNDIVVICVYMFLVVLFFEMRIRYKIKRIEQEFMFFYLLDQLIMLLVVYMDVVFLV